MLPSSLRPTLSIFLVASASLVVAPSRAQAPSSAPPPASPTLSCPVRNTPPSAADLALFHDKFTDAVDLYTKDAQATGPEADRAHNGLIRSLLAAGKGPDAAKNAHDWAAKSPDNAWSLISLAEVQLHNGEMDQAVASIQAAGKKDRCNMRAHVDFAEFSELTGMYATAKRHLEIAHTYEPQDLAVTNDWLHLQPRSVRLQQVTATLNEDKALTDDQRKELKKGQQYLSQPPSPCHLTTPLASTTLALHGIKNGPTGAVDWGLVVGLNGTERRLEIDTGASGLTISRSAAAALHLVSEDEGAVGGIGDHGGVKAFSAKVQSIKIGGLEFHDCNVTVLEKDTGVFYSSDGLIGGDVFKDFLLTLDFPGRQLKLGPLPPLPGASPSDTPELATTAADGDRPAQNAYIAPSMQDWQAIFRNGHELLIPVRLNGKSIHLFLLDTGADVTVLTTESAREVTKVSPGPEMGLQGLSGKVEKTYRTGNLEFEFAGLRYPAHDVVAVDTSSMFSARGLQFSGLLGAGILRRLTMQIDYRDDLVHFTYDPSRLTPCMPGVYREDCYE